MTGCPFFLFQPQHLLDMALQAFSDFFARSMHGQRGNVSAQAHRQVTTLAGFERAALSFKPPFEFRAGHGLRIRQIGCNVNRSVAYRACGKRRTSWFGVREESISLRWSTARQSSQPARQAGYRDRKSDVEGKREDV